jgi:hypothetical protein
MTPCSPKTPRKSLYILTATHILTNDHPRSVKYMANLQKAISYVQPSVFDMLAGASPASARDGWAE